MPYKPGQSGNPGGRPKASLTAAIRQEMSRKSAAGVVNRVAIAERLIMLALGGNIDAVKLILDRTDGKVPEIRQLEGQVNIALSWDDGSSDAD